MHNADDDDDKYMYMMYLEVCKTLKDIDIFVCLEL